MSTLLVSVRSAPEATIHCWGAPGAAPNLTRPEPKGLPWDNPVSRLYRDGRLASIGGGADEVMLGIIAKYMHILPPRR